jgi:hypothetical protein
MIKASFFFAIAPSFLEQFENCQVKEEKKREAIVYLNIQLRVILASCTRKACHLKGCSNERITKFSYVTQNFYRQTCINIGFGTHFGNDPLVFE